MATPHPFLGVDGQMDMVDLDSAILRVCAHVEHGSDVVLGIRVDWAAETLLLKLRRGIGSDESLDTKITDLRVEAT